MYFFGFPLEGPALFRDLQTMARHVESQEMFSRGAYGLPGGHLSTGISNKSIAPPTLLSPAEPAFSRNHSCFSLTGAGQLRSTLNNNPLCVTWQNSDSKSDSKGKKGPSKPLKILEEDDEDLSALKDPSEKVSQRCCSNVASFRKDRSAVKE